MLEEKVTSMWKCDICIMRYEEYCGMIECEIVSEDIHTDMIESIIEMRKWLIEKEYLRTRDEHTDERYTFPLTTRCLPDRRIEERLDLESLDESIEGISIKKISSKHRWKQDILTNSIFLEKERFSEKCRDIFSIKCTK